MLALLGWLGLLSASRAQVRLQAGAVMIAIDDKGVLTSIQDERSGKEYLPASPQASLLSLSVDGRLYHPSSASWDRRRSVLALQYPEKNTRAWVQVRREQGYITFELTRAASSGHIDLAIWGPYPTTITQTIGETVGVVRDDAFGIGIQALNVKTLGGYPDTEDDTEPSFDIFATGNLADINDSVRQHQVFRGQTARLTSFGSVLQAYCRNRDRPRIIANWGYSRYEAPAYADGGVTGSKIALFGAPADSILATIGRIEQEQGLPHPELDGVWAKVSPAATASYLIMGFGEQTIDSALNITRRAGLKYLYQGGPFDTWGHFRLDSALFPDNWESMKRCVDKAEAQGISLGLHTLSDFITTNDPYVTPRPAAGLARVGRTALAADLGSAAEVIPLRDTMVFAQFRKSNLHAAVIGREIIRYRALSDSAPWRLLDCVRGAYGTTATAHQKGEAVEMLMDHGYKVFLADATLQQDMARRLADLFNKTGLKQISFDGLEGCWSSGMGQYACQLFVKTWYDHLNPALRGKVINDASMPGHFFWHIFTRMNWGEPWYAGFRESQTQYRLKNQEYFHRNYIPAMLGWFSMTPQTSLGDIEWLLARAAGYNAGFALTTSMSALHRNGRSEEALALIKTWETARMAGAFSASQQEELRDIHREFHLAAAGKDAWTLTPLQVSYFTFTPRATQPGEPDAQTFDFDNPYGAQPLQCTLSFPVTGKDTSIVAEDLQIELNDYVQWRLPVPVHAGDILQLGADGRARLYDREWQLRQEIPLRQTLKAAKGDNRIRFEAQMPAGRDLKMKIELCTAGAGEKVRARR